MSSRISLGLSRIRQLLKRLDNPQDQFTSIHVAGTNGKGSVSAMIANTLSLAGLKTGLYTSPHLVHRWDVISIDGQTIPKAAFFLLERHLRQEAIAHQNMLASKSHDSERGEITTFEMMTAAAFEAFRREDVDIAVVEVGLGGLEDATNVLTPALSVITSIGLDHTAILGSDIKSIAAAKGGIIKHDVPVVASSDQDFTQVFGVLGKIQREINGQTKLIWTPPNSTLDVRISNQNTARTALQSLRGTTLKNGTEITESLLSDELIERGIRTTRWRGRYEMVDLSNLLGPKAAILDGAHNKQSIEALASILSSQSNLSRGRIFIVSLSQGRDPVLLKRLLKSGDHLYVVQFEPVDDMAWIESMLPHEILSALQSIETDQITMKDYGKDVLSAIRAAALLEGEMDVIICGSLYLVGQVHRMLEAAKIEVEHWDEAKESETKASSYDAATGERMILNYWEDLPPNNPATTLKQPSLKMLLPPPNVTGSLHIGHALTIAIQDAYARFYNRSGYNVQWIPGVDHAGIATQSVVAKQLAKNKVNAHELPREQFLKEIWKWRNQFGERINLQIQRLGTSLRWEDQYFTMDSARSKAVHEVFRKLWYSGLIKREKKMVNWSTKLQSVISDMEVDHKSIDGQTDIEGTSFGLIWKIRYALENAQSLHESDFIEVETTRPETIFGDRVLAVHPKDERYTDLIGKRVKHPLLSQVMLEIVADDFVDPAFGTGCVKITPAHDINDYEVSLRHEAATVIPVFNTAGKMLSFAGYENLAGLDRLSARQPVLDLLKKNNALTGEKTHPMTLNLCSRTGCVIEPMLLPQWFIHMCPLAEQVLAKNDIIMTETTSKEWNRWLSNVQDWCVSRQLIWGHQIPLYRVIDQDDEEIWVFGSNEAEAIANAGGRSVVQDDDVLDTWFSSAILPLSAFGWPDVPLSQDHQLEFIESGPDILFFWLARMAMLCTFMTNTSPFKEIILHPLIRDSQGRKMSKSLGNVIDPNSIIDGQDLRTMLQQLDEGNLSRDELNAAKKEMTKTFSDGIPAAGADALRFALIQSTVQSEALRFDMRSVLAARYLCLKLWNSVNFYIFNTRDDVQRQGLEHIPPGSGLVDNWIEDRLKKTLEVYRLGFEERNLSQSTESLRSFFVDEFCDVYIEFLKADLRLHSGTELRRQRMAHYKRLLEITLKAFSPFMPFITEELWHLLGNRSSIHAQSNGIPEMHASQDCADREAKIEMLLDILKTTRSIENRKSTTGVVHLMDESVHFVAEHIEQLRLLSSFKALSTTTTSPAIEAKDLGRFRISNFITLQILSTDAKTSSLVEPKQLSTREKKDLEKLSKLRQLVEGEHYKARVPLDVQKKHQTEIETLAGRLE